jgi:hypothetical protein
VTPAERLNELHGYAKPIMEKIYDPSYDPALVTEQELITVNNYIDALRQFGPLLIRLWDHLVVGRQASSKEMMESHLCAVDIILSDLNTLGRQILL